MGKRRRQPLRPRCRARPAGASRRWSSPPSRRSSASTSRAASSSSTRASRRRRSRGRRRERHRPRDRDHPRADRRARRLRARDLAASASDRDPVGLPDVQNAQRAIEQVGTTAQLYFYDCEPNVHRAPERRRRRRRTRSKRPTRTATSCSFAAPATTAVQARLEAEASAGNARTARRPAPRYYLFEQDTLARLIAGPRDTQKDLYITAARARRRRPPRATVVLKVPQGTVVVSENPRTTERRPASTRRADRAEFVAQRQPGALRHRHHRPEAGTRPETNQPNVTFNFTDAGREAFQNVTRQIAQRGQSPPPPGDRLRDQADSSPALRGRPRQRDRQSRPIINFAENPDGIDGRTGAQISGGFTHPGGAGPRRRSCRSAPCRST